MFSKNCCQLQRTLASTIVTIATTTTLLLLLITNCRPTEGAVPRFEVCSCWSHYTAETMSDGSMQCASDLTSHVMDCNVVQPPRCMCTGHNVITKDRQGTWCSVFRRGKEYRRWPCENHQEWKEFFAKNAYNKNLLNG